MSARKRKKDSSMLISVISVAVLVVVAFAITSRTTDENKAGQRDHAAERETARVDRQLAVHEQALMTLGQQLGRIRVAEETPCPVQLHYVHVGQQRDLAWVGLGRHGDRLDAPGSQSLAFDHAANRVSILNPDPAAREKELGALFAAKHIAIAIPTSFDQVRPAAEAPGFTGGTFTGYLAVIAMEDRKVVCSAKLDVQIETIANLGGAQLDDLGNWKTWDRPFRLAATAALRRIGGPLAAMAQ